MLRAIATCLAGAVLLLAGCSGGGRPTPTCTRWTPPEATGPGDAQALFPYAQGARWIVRSPGYPWTSVEVSGTTPMHGFDAVNLVGFDLDTRQQGITSYRAVDDHGVVDLGSDDASDVGTPQLVPYYVARFPVAVGDSFTAIECASLDAREDLDGDGQSDLVDVRGVVTVRGFEAVETPVASFAQAARIEQRWTSTIRGSKVPLPIRTYESLATDWVAPGVGPVRWAFETPPGVSIPTSDLVGFAVGAVEKGVLERLEIAGSVAGPYATAPLAGGSVLVAGTGRWAPLVFGEPPTVSAVAVAADGSAGTPFDLLAPAEPVVVSPPAVAAGGGLVAALAAAAHDGGATELLLQRVDASTGTLLEAPEGKVLGAAADFAASGCRPALASDGSSFLGVWLAPDGLRAVRLGADGAVLGDTVIEPGTAPPQPLCPVVAFDGAQYLVVYEVLVDATPTYELRAVHVGADGVVVEAAPIVLAAGAGPKRPLAMAFDGTVHVLLLVDGRRDVSDALVVRRLSATGAWLDGDAATGGVVLDDWWISHVGGVSTQGASLTLSDGTPVVAWATAPDRVAPSNDGALLVTRLGPDGAPLDLRPSYPDPAPGVNAFLGEVRGCSGPWDPVALGAADGVPLVLYSVQCEYEPDVGQDLRAVRFGL